MLDSVHRESSVAPARHDRPRAVGILAVQGDFALHARMLDRVGAPWLLVKHASDLNEAGALIMPGGESTTMLKFFEGENLGPALLDFAAAGKLIFGTCAGAILLAKEVLNPPQSHLGLIDITVERNAYGRQIDSAIRQGVLMNGASGETGKGQAGERHDEVLRDCHSRESGSLEGPGERGRPIEMVFIRAPIIRRIGDGVRVLGRAEGLPVLVEQSNILVATFHPELSDDETIHRYFLSKALHEGGRLRSF
ncbi:MAG TPA: pyridoxal 5'-phosphate synthase glutaminase subunit PdxT [Terriglobia bacterium]|nr:pyridoxal 5'-phosphate synthase glutaminase subunit PdxT [Terriglobia bacterium]